MAKNGKTRIKAIRALALLPVNPSARNWAERALSDKDVDVRLAAATVLGQIGDGSSVDLLRGSLKDQEPRVVLAVAQALYSRGDPAAFAVFRAIMTGEQPAVDGFVATQLRTLKDRKALMWLSLEVGAGFMPYNTGIGLRLTEALLEHPSRLVRAEAARKLSKDPKPEGAEALLRGTGDKLWQVRAAAADAIAARDDPALLAAVVPLLTDKSDTVRFAAAAAVLRLYPLKE